MPGFDISACSTSVVISASYLSLHTYCQTGITFLIINDHSQLAVAISKWINAHIQGRKWSPNGTKAKIEGQVRISSLTQLSLGQIRITVKPVIPIWEGGTVSRRLSVCMFGGVGGVGGNTVQLLHHHWPMPNTWDMVKCSKDSGSLRLAKIYQMY